jgi:glycine dehydrogenase subunit 2
MSGFVVKQLPSDERGNVDLGALRAACDDTVVGLMLTNPNTLGLFEEHLEEVVNLVHGCGGLMYGDGANMNALIGIARPGDLGFDVMHFNLHKTFSTPHGGGGPGSGPVGVSEQLVDFLPGPLVGVTFPDGEDETPLYVFTEPKKSIGRVKSFNGNFGMFVRAYTYMRVHGPDGLKANSMYAVLNANYLRVKLNDKFPCPTIASAASSLPGSSRQRARALTSKRLMAASIHPRTTSVDRAGALMIGRPRRKPGDARSVHRAMRRIADEAVQSRTCCTARRTTRVNGWMGRQRRIWCYGVPVEFEQKVTA